MPRDHTSEAVVTGHLCVRSCVAVALVGGRGGLRIREDLADDSVA